MAFEKIEVLEGQEITPEAVVAKVRGMIDEVAWEVFDQHADMLVDWVRGRLDYLGGGAGTGVDRVELGLNAYNRTMGLGLQSVAVGLKGGGKEARFDNEFKDPTIGVIAPGLVGESAVYQVITFPVDRGRAEIVTPYAGLRIDEATHGNLTGVPSRSAQVMVSGPNHARTVVQMSADKVSADQAASEPNSGVYTCEYINVGDED